MIYFLPTDTCYGVACAISDVSDYHKIYKMKKRSFDKPLALMVENFEWLADNTDLTNEQIDDLKNSQKPFSVLTQCDHLKVWMNFTDDDNNEFINRDIYDSFVFRVATNATQKKLIKKQWPIFLTSANLSGKPEIYKSKEVRDEFEYYLEKKWVEFIWENTGNLENNGPSEIFEYIEGTLEKNIIRK